MINLFLGKSPATAPSPGGIRTLLHTNHVPKNCCCKFSLKIGSEIPAKRICRKKQSFVPRSGAPSPHVAVRVDRAPSRIRQGPGKGVPPQTGVHHVVEHSVGGSGTHVPAKTCDSPKAGQTYTLRMDQAVQTNDANPPASRRRGVGGFCQATEVPRS